MNVLNPFDSHFVVLSESAKREQIEILFREDRKRLQGAPFTDRNNNRTFDLHPDGKRFAVLTAPAQSQTRQDYVHLQLL
jgi:hypothetical protein